MRVEDAVVNPNFLGLLCTLAAFQCKFDFVTAVLFKLRLKP